MGGMGGMGGFDAFGNNGFNNGFDGPGGMNGFGGMPQKGVANVKATSSLQFALILVVLSAPFFPDSEELSTFIGWFLVFAGGALINGGLVDANDFAYALRTDGAYRLSRHPLYGGLVVGCVGVSVLSASPERLAASLVVYLLLSFKAQEEEKSLEEMHGAAYEYWKQHTPRMIPDVSKPRRIFNVLQMGFLEAKLGQHPRQAVEQDVLNQARSAPLLLFTREGDDDCKKALDLLRDLGAEPVVVRLDDLGEVECNLKRAALGRITGSLEVPSCWIRGTYVGSYDEGPTQDNPGLVKLCFQGRLYSDLRDLGVIRPGSGFEAYGGRGMGDGRGAFRRGLGPGGTDFGGPGGFEDFRGNFRGPGGGGRLTNGYGPGPGMNGPGMPRAVNRMGGNMGNKWQDMRDGSQVR